MNTPPIGLTRHRRSVPGGVVAGNPTVASHTRTLIDQDGPIVQVDDINVTGAENSETYTVRFAGNDPMSNPLTLDISAETDGSATQTELRDALIAAINATPAIFFLIEKVEAGTNKVVVTWKDGATGAISFPVNPTTDLTLTSVQSASDVRYFYGYAAKEVANASASDAMHNGGASKLTALAGPVLTLSVDTNADAQAFSGSLLISLPGEESFVFEFDGTSGASAALTSAAISAAIDLSAYGVENTVASPDVELAFPVGATVSVLSLTAGGSLDIGTAAEAGDAMPALFLCIQAYQAAVADDLKGPQANRPISAAFVGDGTVFAVPNVAANYGDKVYVETASGADNGKLFPAPGPSRVRWVGASFRDTQNLSAVEL